MGRRSRCASFSDMDVLGDWNVLALPIDHLSGAGQATKPFAARREVIVDLDVWIVLCQKPGVSDCPSESDKGIRDGDARAGKPSQAGQWPKQQGSQ